MLSLRGAELGLGAARWQAKGPRAYASGLAKRCQLLGT